MDNRCETVGKYVLPLFRSLIAKELVITYNLTQVETAKRLGTTQAAVSQYVNSKRAFKGTKQFSDILPKLQVMARETARKLANGEISTYEVEVDFCKLCSTFSEVQASEIIEDFAI